jgi:regulatory protein
LIYKELKNKGLNQRIINNALNQYLSNQEELEMAEYLKDKWLRRRTEEDSSSYKLKNYLANKGFSYDLIYQVTDK